MFGMLFWFSVTIALRLESHGVEIPTSLSNRLKSPTIGDGFLTQCDRGLSMVVFTIAMQHLQPIRQCSLSNMVGGHISYLEEGLVQGWHRKIQLTEVSVAFIGKSTSFRGLV